jgi:hypothetical protein
MRSPALLLTVAVLLLAACAPQPATRTPPPDGFTPLFNGRDLTGWTPKFAGHPPGENPRNTFRVEDGMLRVSYAEYENFDDLYGHLYYALPYSHYRLRFDYRFTGEQVPGGERWNVRNSGVMLHSQSAESNEIGQHFPVSIELQLMGGLSDGRERPTGNVCTPGTAVVMGDSVDYRHCISSSSPTYDGDGWLSAEAVVRGGEAMHFLIEGDTVLSFTRPQIGGGFTSGAADERDWESAQIFERRREWIDRAGEVLTEGYIALQAESHPIDFRNMRIQEIKDEAR